MDVIRKILHSFILTTNFGLVIALLLCGFIHLVKPVNTSIGTFISFAYTPILALNILFIFYWAVRLKLWFLLSLSGILLTWSTAISWVPINMQKSAAQDKELKVLTFNVEFFEHVEKGPEQEVHPIVQFLKESDVDLICLQEAGPVFVQKMNQKSAVKEALKVYKYVASGYQENRYSVVLLSKYPILDFGRIQYESQSNSSFWYDVVWKNDTIRVINNHLESNKLNKSEKGQYSDLIKKRETEKITEVAELLGSKVGNATVLRANQADSVSAFIQRSENKKILVCGDFNDVPGSYTYRTIREGLKDAWVERGTGWGHTFHDHFFLFRIDYILNHPAFSCTEIKRVKVDYSDHYPLIAKFILP